MPFGPEVFLRVLQESGDRCLPCPMGWRDGHAERLLVGSREVPSTTTYRQEAHRRLVNVEHAPGDRWRPVGHASPKRSTSLACIGQTYNTLLTRHSAAVETALPLHGRRADVECSYGQFFDLGRRCVTVVVIHTYLCTRNADIDEESAIVLSFWKNQFPVFLPLCSSRLETGTNGASHITKLVPVGTVSLQWA